jgi:hypothetical protein
MVLLDDIQEVSLCLSGLQTGRVRNVAQSSTTVCPGKREHPRYGPQQPEGNQVHFGCARGCKLRQNYLAMSHCEAAAALTTDVTGLPYYIAASFFQL